MYSYYAAPAAEDLTVEVTKMITQENLNPRGFKIAVESAVSKIIYPITTQEEFDKITGKMKQRVDAVIRGVEYVLGGLRFTAHADHEKLTGLVVQSASRNHQYIVTAGECQCEGHKNHGNCYHRALYPVFQTYVGLLRAHEEFRRAHARLGIELRVMPEPESIIFGKHQSIDQLFDELMREPIREGERGV